MLQGQFLFGALQSSGQYTNQLTTGPDSQKLEITGRNLFHIPYTLHYNPLLILNRSCS